MCGALCPRDNADAKRLLDRIVVMLTKLGNRGYSIREESGEYRTDADDTDTDPDTDTDTDTEEGKQAMPTSSSTKQEPL